MGTSGKEVKRGKEGGRKGDQQESLFSESASDERRRGVPFADGESSTRGGLMDGRAASELMGVE